MHRIYLVLDAVDLRGLGGDGLQFVGHYLQMLHGRHLDTEDASSRTSEGVAEGTTSDLLAGQLGSKESSQDLVGLASIASGLRECEAEVAGPIEVSAHLHVTTNVGGSGQSDDGSLRDGTDEFVQGGLQLLLADAVADNDDVSADKVGVAVGDDVVDLELLEVGGQSGGAERTLSIGSLQ